MVDLTSPMKLRFLLPALFSVVLIVGNAVAQSANVQRLMEKSGKETLPAGTKKIQEETGAKVALEVNTASYGDDEKAWVNLPIIVNRIVAAILDVGRDQVGKDAIAKSIQKVVIVKSGGEAKDDAAELKDGTLTVKTAANDQSGTSLQDVIARVLEKAL